VNRQLRGNGGPLEDRPSGLAVAQTCAVPGDLRANVAEHLRLARLASNRGAELVLFPELSLTGYEIESAERLALTPDDPRLDPLRDLAAVSNTVLVAGAPLRVGRRLFIGAMVVTPDRRTRVYTKRRLGAFGEAARVDGVPPPPERTAFRAGRRDPLVRLGGQRAAIAVCADIGDPAHAARAAARGAGAYLASMFVIPSDYHADATRLRGYAIRHGFIVAMANHGAPTGGLRAAGASTIWSAEGAELLRLPTAGPGVGVAIREGNRWLVTIEACDVT
jgi:predicted amidohydrolase